VFQPFSRLTDSISHPTGTGIGLSITRNLAQLHGGDIELVACNTGCCFRVMVDVSRHARSDS
jgi:signal transduction histidine kinase